MLVVDEELLSLAFSLRSVYEMMGVCIKPTAIGLSTLLRLAYQIRERGRPDGQDELLTPGTCS